MEDSARPTTGDTRAAALPALDAVPADVHETIAIAVITQAYSGPTKKMRITRTPWPAPCIHRMWHAAKPVPSHTACYTYPRKGGASLVLPSAAISATKCTQARVIAVVPEAFTHPRIIHLGTTILAVDLDKRGHVQRISVSHRSASHLLDRSFVNAAERSTYLPMHCGPKREPSRIILSHDWDSS